MEEKSKFNVVAFFFLCHIIFFEKPFLSIRIHFFYWLLNNFMYMGKHVVNAMADRAVTQCYHGQLLQDQKRYRYNIVLKAHSVHS